MKIFKWAFVEDNKQVNGMEVNIDLALIFPPTFSKKEANP